MLLTLYCSCILFSWSLKSSSLWIAENIHIPSSNTTRSRQRTTCELLWGRLRWGYWRGKRCTTKLLCTWQHSFLKSNHGLHRRLRTACLVTVACSRCSDCQLCRQYIANTVMIHWKIIKYWINSSFPIIRHQDQDRIHGLLFNKVHTILIWMQCSIDKSHGSPVRHAEFEAKSWSHGGSIIIGTNCEQSSTSGVVFSKLK